MCFSSILWLMVTHCLSAFLFGSDYLSVFVGGKFLFVYFPFHVFFHFSSSDIPYFSCSLSSFFGPARTRSPRVLLYGKELYSCCII